MDDNEYKHHFIKAVIQSLIFLAFLLVLYGISSSANDKETWLSEEIQGYCREVGEIYGIQPELLMAIVERESSGKVDAENGSCYGLMQLNLKYHTPRAESLGVDIKSAYGNILTGADLLSELAEKYEDVAITIARYHGEEHVVSRTERGEISKYVKSVLDRSAELERLHYGEETNDERQTNYTDKQSQ